MLLSIRTFIFCTLFVLLYFIPSIAAPTVYSMGLPYGIVADTDWRCLVLNGANSREYGALGLGGEGYLQGESIHQPRISFVFFRMWMPRGDTMKRTEDFLSRYAIVMNNVFSGVYVKKENNDYSIVQGSYIDNKTPCGHFAIFYIREIVNSSTSYYTMFVKIHDDIADETLRDELFQQAFDLITPLYSKK
ncbi:MAG: hypothetical protein LLG04_01240 [Parachlamydia sp.]|nr:hypothetical protein [Parachlamydia sp.]